MSASKVVCEYCGISHGRFVCPAAPGTLERAEWELGRKDGEEDYLWPRLQPQQEISRASRSPYYFRGYRKGMALGKLKEEHESSRWQN